jgi:hypothetical protein
MANPRIEVELGAVTSAFTKSLKNAQQRMSEFATNLKNAASQGLDNLGKSLNELSKKLDSFGKKSTELGKSFSLFVTAPILALGTAAVKTASDTEESFSKFGVVFRDVAKSAEESFKILRNEYGLSSLEAKTLLGSTGDLLTGFGFSQESALELSTEVQKLAVDLASFTNFSGGAAGASDALTKALLGERESVKALGIAILEEDVKKQIAINNSKGLTFETERQAAAYATLELAIAQSANAIGDYNRTSSGFANQSRLLSARLSDLSSEIGEVLLPLMTKLVTFVTGLVNRFTELDSTTKTVIVVVAGLAAAVGPLLLGIGGIIAIIPTFTAGLAALKVAMTAALGPIGILAAAFVGLAFYVVNNFDEIKIASKLLLLDTISFAQNFVKAIDTLVSSIPGFKSVTTAAFGSLQVLGQNVAKSLKENLAEKSAKSFEDLKDSAQESINGIKTSFEEYSKSWDEFNKNFGKEAQSEIDAYNEGLERTAEIASKLDGLSVNLLTKIQEPAKKQEAQNKLNDTDFSAGFTPTIEIADIDDSSVTKNLLKFKEKIVSFNTELNGLVTNSLSNTFANIGQSLGQALAEGGNVIESVGKTILNSLGAFLGELGYMMIQYGTMAIVKAKLDASLLVPGAGFVTGPLAIAAGVALVALSSAIGAKASGGGGGSSVGSSVASQSFTGGGVGGLGGGVRDLTGELVVRGSDLVYVLGQSNNKIAKG